MNSPMDFEQLSRKSPTMSDLLSAGRESRTLRSIVAAACGKFGDAHQKDSTDCLSNLFKACGWLEGHRDDK